MKKPSGTSCSPALERGFLIFLDFNSLLVGGPSNILECLFCTRSGPDGIIHGYRLPNMNSFVQDDWKVSSKLTLNIGVRWEYDGDAERQVREPEHHLAEQTGAQ